MRYRYEKFMNVNFKNNQFNIYIFLWGRKGITSFGKLVELQKLTQVTYRKQIK